MKRILLIALTLAALCFGALRTPILGNNVTAPADWSYWFAKGSVTETVDGSIFSFGCGPGQCLVLDLPLGMSDQSNGGCTRPRPFLAKSLQSISSSAL